MIRRGLFAVVLASMAGCGLIEKVESMPFLWVAVQATRTFDAPIAAVGQAVTEASGVVGAEIVLKKIDLDHAIPFSDDWQEAIDEESLNRQVAYFKSAGIAFWSGETKDGRMVSLHIQPFGDGRKTWATIQIGDRLDPELSKAFFDRVADKLAHPAPPQGDPAPGASEPSPAPKPDDSQPSTQGGPGR